MNIGRIEPVEIQQELQQAYLSYAMSVIVARALPDARDGLKPVQRRILYALHDMGLRPQTPYKKSARVVGEVLGKYHPHGDQAVYDAMARLAQDFSLRYPLVDGQGNFGSLDGDAPAAMRYTEVRLANIASGMLADLEKQTIDFTNNFDETLREPTVLPSALPNLLINGSTGIAVGMATAIPPHNLGEVCAAAIYMLENWGKLDDISTEQLLQFIKGPDFPTGGLMLESAADLITAYSSGRGKLTLQAKIHVEDIGRGRERLIVSEIPYQTNKSNLLERIAELIRAERLQYITDLRDESDRQGLRIVLELGKGANAQEVIAQLFKQTPLQTTVSLILLALVGGEPRTLSLKQALRVFLEHRLVVVQRRANFDLAEAQARAHILAGLVLALQHLDQVIALIRAADNSSQAQQQLQEQLGLSLLQATAILEMPLKRLAKLEQQKLQVELQGLQKQIEQLEKLLAAPKLQRNTIIQELRAQQNAFGDRRRTQIANSPTSGGVQLTANAERCTLMYTNTSKLACLQNPHDLPPVRDFPVACVAGNTTDWLYLFTATGQVACLPVSALPAHTDWAQAIPARSVAPLALQDQVVAALTLPPSSQDINSDASLLLYTHAGMVKRVGVRDLPSPSAHLQPVMQLADADWLQGAVAWQGAADVLLATNLAQVLRFDGGSLRQLGLGAAGVQGIKLRPDEWLLSAAAVPQGAGSDWQVGLLTQQAFGKRCPVAEFPLQARMGKGNLAVPLPPGGQLVGMWVGETSAAALAVQNNGGTRWCDLAALPLGDRRDPAGSLWALTAKQVLVATLPLGDQLPASGKKKKF
jgi:DNA gyrase subunit A